MYLEYLQRCTDIQHCHETGMDAGIRIMHNKIQRQSQPTFHGHKSAVLQSS